LKTESTLKRKKSFIQLLILAWSLPEGRVSGLCECACLLSLFGPRHSCPDLIAAGKYSQAQEGAPGTVPLICLFREREAYREGATKTMDVGL
jgi:hypothetical protein